MIKYFRNCRIRTQFTLIILTAAVVSFLLCDFLWLNRWHVWEISNHLFRSGPDHTSSTFWNHIYEEALKYDLPESEKDTEAAARLQPFFELFDENTNVYIYGLEKGDYRAGKVSSSDRSFFLTHFFRFGYMITDSYSRESDESPNVPVQFRNGHALLQLSFRHRSRFAYLYFLFTVLVYIILFLSIIIFFINRKMKIIRHLKDEVLRMASGDLACPLPDYGADEIGTLAHELDQMRTALNANIQSEQESRRANQDLITAMSHDLRTPLTILKGYLEILQLNRSPDMTAEYLDRCLQKTTDIQELTNRMFEYALVFEETETPKLTPIPLSFFRQCLTENCDFIRLAGFHSTLDFTESGQILLGDETMLKRIFNNIFSNILKYGEKKENVCINSTSDSSTLTITVSNMIKSELSKTESSRIGLKSVEKMINIMHGELRIREENGFFTVILIFNFSAEVK